MNYYIDFKTNDNSVNGGKAGKKWYDALPEKTYYAMGVNGSVKGQAYLCVWDGGTCLIPFHDKDGNIVIKQNTQNEKA